jgi:hypothetical protein
LERADVDWLVSEKLLEEGSLYSLGEGGHEGSVPGHAAKSGCERGEGVKVSRSGGKEVGNWTLKHASTAPRDYEDSVFVGHLKLL